MKEKHLQKKQKWTLKKVIETRELANMAKEVS